MGRIFQALILGPVVAMTTRKKVCIVSLKPNKDLDYMNALFATGKFKPVIDGAYALSEVAEAMRYFGTGRHQGKVVITVDEH